MLANFISGAKWRSTLNAHQIGFDWYDSMNLPKTSYFLFSRPRLMCGSAFSTEGTKTVLHQCIAMQLYPVLRVVTAYFRLFTDYLKKVLKDATPSYAFTMWLNSMFFFHVDIHYYEWKTCLQNQCDMLAEPALQSLWTDTTLTFLSNIENLIASARGSQFPVLSLCGCCMNCYVYFARLLL